MTGAKRGMNTIAVRLVEIAKRIMNGAMNGTISATRPAMTGAKRPMQGAMNAEIATGAKGKDGGITGKCGDGQTTYKG